MQSSKQMTGTLLLLLLLLVILIKVQFIVYRFLKFRHIFKYFSELILIIIFHYFKFIQMNKFKPVIFRYNANEFSKYS